jgi:hypothetical protein
MLGRPVLVGLFLLAASAPAFAHEVVAPAGNGHQEGPVTVYLDRDGGTTDDGVEIPAYTGSERTWNAVVACVQKDYAPFQVNIVTQQPSGSHITAMVGGRASLMNLDDRTTNGVGPYSGQIIPNATVHIFSEVGTGPSDVENLCAVTAHEVGHALGLDHEVYCGDIMSYYLDRCGVRHFVDADAPCGETSTRACGGGEQTQNSYRRLGELVGYRDATAQPQRPQPQPQPQQPDFDPWGNNGDDGTATTPDDSATPPPPPAQPVDPYAGQVVTVDRHGNLWVGQGKHARRVQNGGTVREYTVRRGNTIWHIRVVNS